MGPSFSRSSALALSLPNIISIVRNHFDALEPLYQLSIGGKLDADMTTIAAEMGENFGPVAVSVVAVGMRTKALDKVAGDLIRIEGSGNEAPSGAESFIEMDYTKVTGSPLVRTGDPDIKVKTTNMNSTFT